MIRAGFVLLKPLPPSRSCIKRQNNNTDSLVSDFPVLAKRRVRARVCGVFGEGRS
jgi:hypothetical protein